METKVLSRCNAYEIKNIADNIIFELEQKDFTDSFLANLNPQLKSETSILTHSLGFDRKNKYTSELNKINSVFDKRVVCLKNFVNANKYSWDAKIAVNADKIWDKIKNFDLYFYKLGYEKKLSRTFSLIDELEKPNIKPILKSLVGGADSLRELKSVATDFIDLYRKKENTLAQKEKITPATTQKKKVINIINKKLLPYLRVKSETNPDKYKKVNNNVIQYIETVNNKIRALRNREKTHER